MSGFIALHREAFDHPILKDGERFRAWFWLVANAAWKPTRHDARGRTIHVERGQICAGREQLAKAWGWSPSAVERFLTRLETEHMIERETGQGKSLITICNYEKYQDAQNETGQLSGQQTGQKSDRNRTAKEQGNKGTIEKGLETYVSCPSRDGPEPDPEPEFALQPDDDPSPADDASLKPDHVVEAWNDLAERIGKPKIRALTPERRVRLKSRIAGYSIDEFREVFGNIEASPFLRGDTGWPGCTFDWITKKANFQKALEGNYNE